jgi:hypothetical protein
MVRHASENTTDILGRFCLDWPPLRALHLQQGGGWDFIGSHVVRLE